MVVPIGMGGVTDGHVPPVPVVTEGADTDGDDTDGADTDGADRLAAAAEFDPPACGCTAGIAAPCAAEPSNAGLLDVTSGDGAGAGEAAGSGEPAGAGAGDARGVEWPLGCWAASAA